MLVSMGLGGGGGSIGLCVGAAGPNVWLVRGVSMSMTLERNEELNRSLSSLVSVGSALESTKVSNSFLASILVLFVVCDTS